jgi:hypothetical protein
MDQIGKAEPWPWVLLLFWVGVLGRARVGAASKVWDGGLARQ